MMMRRLLLVPLLLLAMTGCSASRRELDSNPPYSQHRYIYHDAEVKWQTQRSDGLLRLDGTVTNRRHLYMWGLEINVRLLDEKGKLLARDSFADFPLYLAPGEPERFLMKLSLPPGATPARLRFTYTYWLVEEPPTFRKYDDDPRFGHFESPL